MADRRRITKSKRVSGAVRGSIRGTGAGLHAGVHGAFHEMRQAAVHTATAGVYGGLTPVAGIAGGALGAKRGFKHPNSASYKLRPHKRQNKRYTAFNKGPR